MTNEIVAQPKEVHELISTARDLSQSASWLSPVEGLTCKSGSEFGRHIREEMKTLSISDEGALALSVQSKTKAVVITLKRYNEILEIMDSYKAMIQLQKEQVVDDAQSYFDMAFKKMNSEESLTAIDSLFSAESEDLSNAYRPGRTEMKP